MTNTLLKNKTIKKNDLKIFKVVDTPEEVLRALSGYRGNARNRT